MIKRNKKGHLYIDPWESNFKEVDVVMRMNALIGLVKNQDESLIDYADVRYAMEMLGDLLPTVEQAEVYLMPEERIRILSEEKQ